MSGPFDDEINNINISLNILIEKYTKISENFKTAIQQQNEKLNKEIELIKDNYNENLKKYDFMKNYQPKILNNINEIKTNLVRLENLVVNTGNLEKPYMNVFGNRYDNEFVGPFDHQIYNINTNLKNWIEKYTTFLQQIEKQNKNIQLTPSEYNYVSYMNNYINHHQPIILNNIDVIKTNLVRLENLVVYTDNLGEKYMIVFKNRYEYSELVNKLNKSNLNEGGKKHCKKTKKHLRSRRVRKRKSMKQKKHNKKYIGGNDYYENV